MAAAAVVPVGTVMGVVRGVAAFAAHREIDLLLHRSPVAVIAMALAVGPVQGKIRLTVVVEQPERPTVRVVATTTVATQAAQMGV